jgi:hypothetical protein
MPRHHLLPIPNRHGRRPTGGPRWRMVRELDPVPQPVSSPRAPPRRTSLLPMRARRRHHDGYGGSDRQPGGGGRARRKRPALP